jgi:predicted methyltransferase
MKIIFLFAIAFSIAVGNPAWGADVPGYVVKAVADRSRPKGDREDDPHRLPAETIAFAGVAPGMVIAEFEPFYGYFTRILTNVVGPNGKIYGIDNKNWENPAFDKKLLAQCRNLILRTFKWGDFDLPEKVDLFWITQNYHDLYVTDYGHVDVPAFNRRVFDALKPGGIYFISDQSGNPGMTIADITALHRINEAQVIREVTAAGFVLVGESDVLRHPHDDLSRSIFNPVVRGQTDEFMLKFQKP